MGCILARVCGRAAHQTWQIRGIGAGRGEKAATAAYVAALTADLAALARKQKLDTLGYLLDMARLGADDTARGSKGG